MFIGLSFRLGILFCNLISRRSLFNNNRLILFFYFYLRHYFVHSLIWLKYTEGVSHKRKYLLYYWQKVVRLLPDILVISHLHQFLNLVLLCFKKEINKKFVIKFLVTFGFLWITKDLKWQFLHVELFTTTQHDFKRHLF